MEVFMQPVPAENNAEQNMRLLKRFGGIFVLVGLLSCLGGGMARFAWDIYGQPEWLDALVGIFIGLAFCFMSLAIFAKAFTYDWDTNSCEAITQVLWAFVIGIPILFGGIFCLWKSLAFFNLNRLWPPR
jgi:hypothetical protein